MNIDVTIVGAGLVGCTLACLLSNQGLKVGIVDRNNPLNVSKESELQGRTVALNLSSVGIFQDLDLFESLEALGLFDLTRAPSVVPFLLILCF